MPVGARPRIVGPALPRWSRMPSRLARPAAHRRDLDDEQREAVLAARGPVCVLAGAGTGKTRTITRRIAHLVAAGHVAPGQVLAVTFTPRAAGEMRGRLRALERDEAGVGTASVQAMTFHAAARRQLQYFWPRVVGDTGWELLDTQVRASSRRPPTGPGYQASTDDVRDLAGEIEWAKASLISPEDYAAAVAEAGRDIPFDAAQGRRRLRRLRGAQGPPRRIDAAGLRRPAAAHRRRHRERRRGRRRSSATATAASSSTSTRTSRRCSSGCSTPGSATATTSPSSATPTRPSTRSPAPRRATCSISPGDSPTPRSSDWSATTAPPRRWCRWPTGSSRPRAAGWRAASCTWSASARRGPSRRSASTRRGRRGGRGGPQRQEAHRIRNCRFGNRGPLPHQRAVGGLRGGAHRSRRAVPGSRRRGVLQPPGDPPGAAGVAARRRTGHGRRRGRVAGGGARHARAAGPDRGAAAGHPCPGALGGAGARWPNSSTTRSTQRPQLDLRALVIELRQRADCPPPTGGAGRHAGLAARRQGPGVGCGVPGRARRRHAADLARAGARPRQ